MTSSDIPRNRPPGSPLAKRWGATDANGEKVPNVVPVRKSAPRPASPHDGLSPLERVNGRTPDGGRLATAQALALLHGPSIAQIQTLQRVSKAKAAPKLPPGAIYDGNGTLLGVVAADGTFTPVVDAVAPAAPAAPAKSVPIGPPAMGTPGSNPPRGPGLVPVQKARRAATREEINANIRAANQAWLAKQAARLRGRR